jgi:hypothetical protein
VAVRRDPLGAMLVLIPWTGAALVWLWPARTMLVDHAMDNLVFLVMAIGFTAALFVAVDAMALEFGKRGTPAAAASRPGPLFGYVCLFWPMMLPIYLHERSKYCGRPRWLLLSIAGVVTLIASALECAYLAVAAAGPDTFR